MEDKLAARKSTSGSDVTTKSTRETDIPATFYSILLLTRMISGRKVDRSPHSGGPISASVVRGS